MLSSTDISHHIKEYGEVMVSCPVYLSKGIHTSANECVLQYTCGLLNSGGGLLIMRNVEHSDSSQSKSLDTWWSGMESNLANILSGDDICNYLDFIGNFDDRFLYLFVKSAEHLCTLDYHCRLPTDTATHCVTYKSALKLCSRTDARKSLSSLPSIPTTFVYGKIEDTLKQEGKQIQFKYLSSQRERKTVADRINYCCTNYITAFANHEGGHIYFGIEDTTAAVLGEEVTEADEKRIAHLIQSKMDLIIWSDSRIKTVKGVHWDLQFIPVNHCPNAQRRRVIVVSVCKWIGGVFTKVPESYIISTCLDSKSNEPWYSVRKLQFDEWKAELLNQSRDIKSLHTRFVKVPLNTPQSRLVFSLPHTVQASRQKVIYLSPEFNLQPKNILQSFVTDDVKSTITKLVSIFIGEPHLAILLESWGLELTLPPKPSCVKACVAVFSALRELHVVSIVSHPDTEEKLWAFTRNVAVNFKQILVQHGGCNSRLGIKVHIVDTGSPQTLDNFREDIHKEIYPETYRVSEHKMNDVLTALTVAIASYKPYSSSDKSIETDHCFLLTCDQLELLWNYQFTRELWIHGPPGSGKTIAALEMIKELSRRGCRKEEILYVAENVFLCSYVSSFNYCMVTSRRQLMEDAANSSLAKKFIQIKNVIVDEAQNFKDRDGDWYSFLEKLSQQNMKDSHDISVGYFWVFMDYAQKVHKFKAGLPSLIGKSNFMLREISRNSREIYDYATKFMQKPDESVSGGSTHGFVEDDPCLGHDYRSGQDVNVVKCDRSDISDMLYNVLQQFADKRIDTSDIAILVSKKKDAEELEKSVKENKTLSYNVTRALEPASKESEVFHVMQTVASSTSTKDPHLPLKYSSQQQLLSDSGNQCQNSDTVDMQTPPNNVKQMNGDRPLLVSTVRDFSGLDKHVIIGVDPHANEEHADLDKLILNLVTRARDSLVILTTSDKLAEKLKSS